MVHENQNLFQSTTSKCFQFYKLLLQKKRRIQGQLLFKNYLHMICKNKHRPTAQYLKKLYHYHVAGLAWLLQEYLFLVKKQQGNTENSVEIELFVTSSITHSLIQFCLFKLKIIADQHFFTLLNFICINMCILYMYLFALNEKKATILYEDVKVVCKIICSLVKQNIVC